MRFVFSRQVSRNILLQLRQGFRTSYKATGQKASQTGRGRNAKDLHLRAETVCRFTEGRGTPEADAQRNDQAGCREWA